MATKALIVLVAMALEATSAFVPRASSCRPRRSAHIIMRRLYEEDQDEPIPRFVANDNNSNQPKDDDHLNNIPRLFEIQINGREARNLLPPLSRSLISGVECYYEVTDRPVQNLCQKTVCHPMDAAWALEACRGDFQEAWLAISTARKVLLNEQDNTDEEDWDEELFAVLQENKELVDEDEEDYDERKQRLVKEERDQKMQQAIKDAFSLGEVDGEWLPTKNPKPMDDEPWFTG